MNEDVPRSSTYEVAVPPLRPKWQRFASVVGGMAVAATITGAITNAAGLLALDPDGERNPQGTIIDEGDVRVDRLRVGDCLHLGEEWTADMVESLEDLEHVESFVVEELPSMPCTATHNGEVISVDDSFFSRNGGGTGDEQTLGRIGMVACIAELERYTGERYSDSRFDVAVLVPALDSLFVDRSLTCISVTLNSGYTDVISTTGSMRAEAPPATISIEVLESTSAGDCLLLGEAFDEQNVAYPFTTGHIVSCAATHEGEVVYNDVDHYANLSRAPSRFSANRDCATRFERYTGFDPEPGALTVRALAPNALEWAMSGRALTCVAVTTDHDGNGLVRTSGSLRVD